MGADNFSNIELGKTATVAFDRAVKAAQWEDGHGGYTGTIAEKHSFRTFEAAAGKRWTAGQVVSLVVDAAFVYDEKDRKRAAKALARLDDIFGRGAGQCMAETYDDKWGPAIAVRLPKSHEKRIKEERGRKGTHDQAWLFFGLASS